MDSLRWLYVSSPWHHTPVATSLLRLLSSGLQVQEKNKRAQARYRQKQKVRSASSLNAAPSTVSLVATSAQALLLPQEKMQGFEEQCHRLTEDLKTMTAAYSQVDREKAALEMEMRNLRLATTSSGMEAPTQPPSSMQPSNLQPSQMQPNQPHRPVPHTSGPVGWVNFMQSLGST